MKTSSNQNYILSSNLFFIAAALSLINTLLSGVVLYSIFFFLISLLEVALLTGLGFVIRAGVEWIKYVLWIYYIFIGDALIKSMVHDFHQFPAHTIIQCGEVILLLLAMVVLFLKPKNRIENGQSGFKH